MPDRNSGILKLLVVLLFMCQLFFFLQRFVGRRSHCPVFPTKQTLQLNNAWSINNTTAYPWQSTDSSACVVSDLGPPFGWKQIHTGLSVSAEVMWIRAAQTFLKHIFWILEKKKRGRRNDHYALFSTFRHLIISVQLKWMPWGTNLGHVFLIGEYASLRK